jgi:hypothetical protein
MRACSIFVQSNLYCVQSLYRGLHCFFSSLFFSQGRHCFFFVRRKCEHATYEALQNGHRVVIDRTNIDAHQRSHWLRIARECRVPAAATAALLLQVDVQTCKFTLFYLFFIFCIFMLYLCFKWTFRNARIVKRQLSRPQRFV